MFKLVFKVDGATREIRNFANPSKAWQAWQEMRAYMPASPALMWDAYDR